MEQYQVSGMSCAACAARIEQAVGKVEGVSACSVSLLTNSMGVEGTASADAVMRAVRDAGYEAAPQGNASKNVTERRAREEEQLNDTETPALKKRLLTSIAFLLLLLYLSMGHGMWGWPVPTFLEGNPVGIGVLQMLLAGVVLLINQRFFSSGWRSVRHGAPNMDTLVALGAGVSFGYSVWVLLRMTGKGAMTQEMPDLYFESAAMIVTLITVGKLLESVSKGKTTNALRALMALSPQTATLLVNGHETEVPIEEVQVGSVYVVRPGESIPVDGIILDGNGAVNEAALTGESIPVEKQEGESVSAATINENGYLTCRATRVGEDTTLSQIIRMVREAAATKAPIARIADRISGIFVPAVILIAAATFLIWMLCGAALSFALERAVSVLVISCPCALGLATPVAIMVGNGVGARNGILFKTSAALEETGRVNIVALDKTGTLTQGLPRVTEVIPAEGITETELLQAACSLEAQSEHPLARAIAEEARKRGLLPDAVQSFRTLPGNGVTAINDGSTLDGGSLAYLRTKTTIPSFLEELSASIAQQGKTPLFFAQDQKILGIIAVADVLREDSAAAIRDLKALGMHTVLLTGDNAGTAAAIAKEADIDEVIADVLPDGKEEVIRRLQEQGTVAMVGDGINDAPALTRADSGLAIGAGTDVAIDAADVVLTGSSLGQAVSAIRLSRATLRNIHQNLFWAFFYNVLCIPLAAGAYVYAFGWTLSPMVGAAAMSLSSFCVVMNALRLNFVKL